MNEVILSLLPSLTPQQQQADRRRAIRRARSDRRNFRRQDRNFATEFVRTSNMMTRQVDLGVADRREDERRAARAAATEKLRKERREDAARAEERMIQQFNTRRWAVVMQRHLVQQRKLWRDAEASGQRELTIIKQRQRYVIYSCVRTFVCLFVCLLACGRLFVFLCLLFIASL